MLASNRFSRIAKRIIFRAAHKWRRPHVVVADVCGLHMQISSASVIAEAVYANAFERTQRAALDRLIRPQMTVFDVGANVGFYSCLFARRVGPEGRVVAVEPTPDTYRKLVDNATLNGFLDRIHCLQAAVADVSGERELHVFPEAADVFNSLTRSSAYGQESGATKVRVPTVTLDQLIEEQKPTGDIFVKIDVEGFEREVLQGARFTLERQGNISLMVELSGSATESNDLLRMLDEIGFDAYIPGRDRFMTPITKVENSQPNDSCDVFFVRRESDAKGRLVKVHKQAA